MVGTTDLRRGGPTESVPTTVFRSTKLAHPPLGCVSYGLQSSHHHCNLRSNAREPRRMATSCLPRSTLSPPGVWTSLALTVLTNMLSLMAITIRFTGARPHGPYMMVCMFSVYSSTNSRFVSSLAKKRLGLGMFLHSLTVRMYLLNLGACLLDACFSTSTVPAVVLGHT